MEKLKLGNEALYELVTNGIRENGEQMQYVFLPDSKKTFEQIENDFLQKENTEKVYVVGADGTPIRSIVGFISYKGMEKIINYVISEEMVNTGTEEEPVYESKQNVATVMIVTMRKQNITDKVEKLEKTSNVFLTAATFAAVTFTDEQALQVPELYPEWSPDSISYKTGERIRYNSILYKVLQDHESQESWTPDTAHSLFAKVLIENPDIIPDWEQPSAENAYMTGDKVRHKEKVWESLVDNNVWEPGVVGTESLWKEVKE